MSIREISQAAYVSNGTVLMVCRKLGYEGSRLLRIVPEYDAPWMAVMNRISTASDEEKIEELVYQYCYALDHDMIRMYDAVFSSHLLALYSGDRYYNKRTCTAMLKFEREGMIGRGHMMYIEDCHVNGNTASAHLYRTGYIPTELCV